MKSTALASASSGAEPVRPAPLRPGRRRRRTAVWAAWLLGAAVLAALVAAVRHFGEERELARALEDARPWWLACAFALQALTYVAQGQAWRIVLRRSGQPISTSMSARLALAKLFVDQALPSGGISGTLLVARALEARGIPRPAVMASVLVGYTAFTAAYTLALVVALVLAALGGHTSLLFVGAALLVILFGALVAGGGMALAGHVARVPPALRRLPFVGGVLQVVAGADASLARAPQVIARAGLFELIVMLLDAATIWVLILALGAHASPIGVFASFILSSLLRTVGIAPGGLGTFEAASVLTLKLAGVPVAIALTATLGFRALSFWLPMLPGLYFSRALTRGPRRAAAPDVVDWWSRPADDVVGALGGTRQGLSWEEATRRLVLAGPNEIAGEDELSRVRVLWHQLRSPLLALLLFAATVAIATSQWADAVLVFLIVIASVGIGYSREARAQSAALALRERVRAQAIVVRDGRDVRVPARDVVPGDVVRLSAGSVVPADGVLLEAHDFFVNEAVLTGESFPVEKKPGIVERTAALHDRRNAVFLGTNVRSGAATYLVVDTGMATHFGDIARRLALRPPETGFDRGLRRFGALLTTTMLALVLVVFTVNMLLERPVIETLLFSVALAVGLSPELLPAVLTVNLARGAQMMARHGVLVRRLNAIEDLGSMDILCTDKTGTLTEGVVRLQGAWSGRGERSDEVLRLAALNAALQSGLQNPLDDAIAQALPFDAATAGSLGEKLGEIPYDFSRKRLSVVVRNGAAALLVTKGAFERVLDVCTRDADGAPLDEQRRAAVRERFRLWSEEGIRVLAVSTRDLEVRDSYRRDDERDLTLRGFLTFLDRPKEGVERALGDLAALGVTVKVITGDAALVARHVATTVGLPGARMLTGAEIAALHDDALPHAAERTDLFVEVDPNQKERILLALKKLGHVVGFLGDGVNDAPAMHAADTSISVESAVDVAKQAADFVLLERDLDVVRRGVEEGRRTFANTLKYVLTTTSANLGNMLSMAAASLFLPFLPLTAGQILLNNFLSDVPAVGIASDSVDPELVARPRRWDIRFIARFMLEFGLVSSLFDALTFTALLLLFASGPELFRTGWFVESLLTELVVALVVRTRRPFFQSRPGRLLLLTSLALIAVALALPYLPFAAWLGFSPLPPAMMLTIVGITALYVAATEALKHRFYRGTQAPGAPVRPASPLRFAADGSPA